MGLNKMLARTMQDALFPEEDQLAHSKRMKDFLSSDSQAERLQTDRLEPALAERRSLLSQYDEKPSHGESFDLEDRIVGSKHSDHG